MPPVPIGTLLWMESEEYHSRVDFVSKTMLSVLADSPAKFEYVYIKGGERPESDAMRLGIAAHLYALERPQFDREYHVMSNTIKRDARHKAYQEQIVEANGRTILKESELAQVRGMGESLLRNPKAVALLGEERLVERSIFWHDVEHGVNLRCRPDVIRLKDGIIVNLKTARSARPETFHRTAFDMLYDVSVAIECRGLEVVTRQPATEYVFLAIETEPPYIVEAYNCFERCTAEGLNYRDIGEHRLRRLLETYAKCVRTETWPSYQDGITPMQVPAWALKQLEYL